MDNQQNQTNPQQIQALDEQALLNYVEGLIKEKNSPYVTEANMQDVRDDLVEQVSDAINQKMIEALSDAQVEQLNALLDKEAKNEELGQFFSQHIPNLPQLVSHVLMDFRAGYLSVVPKDSQAAIPQPASENQHVSQAPLNGPQNVPVQATSPTQQTPDVTQAIREQLATLMTPELPDHISHEEEIMAAPPAPLDMPPPVPVAPVSLQDYSEKKVN